VRVLCVAALSFPKPHQGQALRTGLRKSSDSNSSVRCERTLLHASACLVGGLSIPDLGGSTKIRVATGKRSFKSSRGHASPLPLSERSFALLRAPPLPLPLPPLPSDRPKDDDPDQRRIARTRAAHIFNVQRSSMICRGYSRDIELRSRQKARACTSDFITRIKICTRELNKYGTRITAGCRFGQRRTDATARDTTSTFAGKTGTLASRIVSRSRAYIAFGESIALCDPSRLCEFRSVPSPRRPTETQKRK